MGTSAEKRNIIIARIAVDALLLFAVFFAHWAVVLVIGVIGIFLFPRYGEVVLAGILLDVLYGGGLVFGVLPYTILYTVITMLLFGAGVYLKQFIRFYDT